MFYGILKFVFLFIIDSFKQLIRISTTAYTSKARVCAPSHAILLPVEIHNYLFDRTSDSSGRTIFSKTSVL